MQTLVNVKIKKKDELIEEIGRLNAELFLSKKKNEDFRRELSGLLGSFVVQKQPWHAHFIDEQKEAYVLSDMQIAARIGAMNEELDYQSLNESIQMLANSINEVRDDFREHINGKQNDV